MTTDKPNWDSQQVRRQASFLQSEKWGEFQATVSAKPHFVSGDGYSCLVLEKTNRLGKYLFAPYGPTLDDFKHLDACLDELVVLAKQLGAGWLKLEPISAAGQTSDIINGLRRRGGRLAAHNAEPALTRVLDLSPAADNLLAGISQSTRSLIRKTQRENILTFKTSTQPSDMTAFAGLLDTVADRKGIGFFPKSYFIKQAQILMPAKMMFLEQAYQGKTLVGAAVMHDYGVHTSYTYAASLPRARKLSVSALLLWQAILNAKARGSQKLDLYGIAPEDAAPNHPWYGFSAYKKKFGGEIVQTAGTWDIPISQKYRLYRSAQTAHRILRRR
jgi:lipid II:glycine glycyltransferase (peptidoglycan interpeptide bridge formation enzyme)